jgi:hypothetical protein
MTARLGGACGPADSTMCCQHRAIQYYVRLAWNRRGKQEFQGVAFDSPSLLRVTGTGVGAVSKTHGFCACLMGNLASVGKSAPTGNTHWRRTILVLLIISTGITFVSITRSYAPCPELHLCISRSLAAKKFHIWPGHQHPCREVDYRIACQWPV